jgi:uncharacterized paraquat-inducible protein A
VGERLQKGQQIVCDACDTRLNVVNLEPLEFSIGPGRNVRLGPKPKVVDIPCPACDDFIQISAHVHKGQRVVCAACKNTLEVISTDPLELDLPMKAKVRGHYHNYVDSLDDDDTDYQRSNGNKRSAWR